MSDVVTEIEAGVGETAETGSAVRLSVNQVAAPDMVAVAIPVRPPRRCALTGYVPNAFNVRVRCNREQGHRGSCDFSNGFGRVGTFARSARG